MAGRVRAVSRKCRAEHHRQRGAGAATDLRLIGVTVASLPAAARVAEQPVAGRRHPRAVMSAPAEPAGLAMEHKSIDYIDQRERHGRVADQVPFWFLANFHFFSIAIGFVGPSMGLSFGYTSLAGALGILF